MFFQQCQWSSPIFLVVLAEQFDFFFSSTSGAVLFFQWGWQSIFQQHQ